MCTKCLSENLKGKRPPGRPKNRWKGNVEWDHGDIRWEIKDWISMLKSE
jgi:hypothetical protein